MLKHKTHLIYGLLLFCAFNFFEVRVLSYGVPTHRAMSELTVKSYECNLNRFLLYTGFEKGIDTMLRGRSVLSIIQWGAEDEDNLNFLGLNLQDTRPFRHFYNPLNNSGLTDFPLNRTFPSSLEWAWNHPNNEYSWQVARGFYYKWLVSKSVDEREFYAYKTLDCIGHLVHLVQDLGQPQHTRNDAHSDLDENAPYESYVDNVYAGKGKGDARLMASKLHLQYTDRPDGDYWRTSGKSENCDRILNDEPHRSMGIPCDLKSLWDTEQYRKGVVIDELKSPYGLAEYSSYHFVTDDTLFTQSDYIPESALIRKKENGEIWYKHLSFFRLSNLTPSANQPNKSSSANAQDILGVTLKNIYFLSPFPATGAFPYPDILKTVSLSEDIKTKPSDLPYGLKSFPFFQPKAIYFSRWGDIDKKFYTKAKRMLTESGFIMLKEGGVVKMYAGKFTMYKPSDGDEFNPSYREKGLCGDEKKGELCRFLILDNDTWESYAIKLIPKSISYSAKLINYFFRSQYDGNITIRERYEPLGNNAKQPKRVCEASVLYREPLKDGVWTILQGSASRGFRVVHEEKHQELLAPGVITFRFDPDPIPVGDQSKAEEFIAVFKGTIGQEKDEAVAVTRYVLPKGGYQYKQLLAVQPTTNR